MRDRPYRERAGGVLRFVGHYLEMVVAMVLGMLLLDPLWSWLLPGPTARADVAAVVAATDMSIAMATWMWLRGHARARTIEMVAAMCVPFLVLLVPYWAGAISGSALMSAGHNLMMLAMLAAMLWRRAEYTHRHHGGGPRRQRFVRGLARVGVVAVAVAALPGVVFAVNASADLKALYEPAADTSVPASVGAGNLPVHDPAKPTAVVLLSNQGANAGDALGPYEILAATGAYNLYTVASERRRVPLTGGLDLVPDLSFADLDRRLAGRAADVVAVPQVPDGGAAATERLENWLVRQAGGGALLLGVCRGSELLASAGLLDGRDATSNWLRISALEERHPTVRWHRATRYVDDGQVITTGAVLSGIDGTLRVIERRLGARAASAAAAAVGWEHYSPGKPAPLPANTFGMRDMIAGVNLGFRPNQELGVLLTDGVGEIELAAVFVTYTEAAYAARTVAIGLDSGAPVRSRHGLVFVPRGDASTAADLDRLLVPGADAARRRDPAVDGLGLVPEYLHAQPGFAFDAALRDMARTVDVPTARWRAKALEYPASELTVSGPGWPWGFIALPLLYGLVGLVVAAAVWFACTGRRRHGHPGSGAG